MRERPILFSAPMVRALLDGTKTQTRRVCKSQPYSNGFQFDGHDILCHNDYLPPSAMLMDVKRGPHRYTASDAEGWEVECPYGQPGDRLWVRETARCNYRSEQPPADKGCIGVDYRAGGSRMQDYTLDQRDNYPWFPSRSFNIDQSMRWQPAIHMPRWASRIDLEVTGVRVERLKDISEADARAEGARECDPVSGREVLLARPSQRGSFVLHYRDIWEQINGPGSWEANPWVWVVEFRRIRP